MPTTWTDETKPTTVWTDVSNPTTVWTDTSKPTTAWTDETKPTTQWTQLEPMGFGLSPFGDPTEIESGLKIHIRGFGDPTTKWTEHTGD